MGKAMGCGDGAGSRAAAGAAVGPYLLVAVLLGSIVLSACAGSGASGGTVQPRWVSQLIQQFESEPVANPPLAIYQYQYRGKVVYYVPPRCCDIQSDLYDAEGKLICHPDGGITGSGDGRCTDFFDAREGERLIWKDSRTYP